MKKIFLLSSLLFTFCFFLMTNKSDVSYEKALAFGSCCPEAFSYCYSQNGAHFHSYNKSGSCKTGIGEEILAQ